MKTRVVFSFAMFVFAVPTMCLAAGAVVPAPEPATGLLLLLGGAGTAAYRKMKTRRKQ